MSSETVVQQRARLLMAQLGAQCWRNNSGACIDETGRLIRYGLGNDSAQLNAKIKSSDLIGATPVQAYVQGIGWTVLGVFTALECKPSGWRMPTPIPGRKFEDQPEATQRALAQAKFHEIVRGVGGFAGFVTDPADIYGIIRRGG